MSIGNSGATQKTAGYLGSGSPNFNPYTAAVQALTVLGEVDVSEAQRAFVQLNTDVTLTGFQIEAKCEEGAAYVALCKIATDYTTPKGLVVAASGDLTTLANGIDGWVMLDVRGIKKLRFKASAAAAANPVVRWGYN